MNKIQTYTVLTLICVFFLVLLPVIKTTYAETKILNPNSKNRLILNTYASISNFSIDEKTVDFHIGFTAGGNESFQMYMKIPGGVLTQYNSTKELKSEWYNISPKDEPLRSVPLQTDYVLNPWPYDAYHVDVFMITNKDFSLEFDIPQNVKFESSLSWNKDWKVEMQPKLSTFKDLPDLTNLFFTSQIFDYQIVLSHTDKYISDNLIFFIMPIIVALVPVIHIIFFRHKKESDQIKVFLAILVISLPSELLIRPYLPHELTIGEAILISSIILYPCAFVYILIKERIRRGKERDYHPEYIK